MITWLTDLINDVTMDIAVMLVLSAILFVPMRIFGWLVKWYSIWRWGG